MGKLFPSEVSWKPKTQPNDSRDAVWLSFWFSTRPSAETVTNLYRADYHQLVIVMLKVSHYDEIPQANAYGEVIISWKLQHHNHQLMIMCSVLISYCVCRRPSWKPKTQPNGSSAVVWLSFWFSTRFTRK